jgi:hypothetical protein
MTLPTWEELTADWDNEPPPQSPERPPERHESDERAAPSSWEPQDIRSALDGDGPPPAVYLTRTDNVSLIYPGRVHWIQGESESLKSWLLLLGVAQALIAGFNVIWIDFEDDAIGVSSRLKNLGVPVDVLADLRRFVYIQPTDGLYDHKTNVALPGAVVLAELLRSNEWHLVGIDGVTEAMTVEGLSLLDNADIATWLRVLPKYITGLTGAAVAAIDHVTKSKETQGRFAIGGQHKLAGTTGATYKVTSISNLSRAIRDPIVGQSLITIQKDRPGWVRPHQQGDDKRIAILEVTSYPDGGVSARLLPPDQAEIMPPWVLCEKILQFLTRYDGASKNTVENDVEGRAETIREAVRWMVDKGWIRVERIGRSHAHSVTPLGQSQMNQAA